MLFQMIESAGLQGFTANT